MEEASTGDLLVVKPARSWVRTTLCTGIIFKSLQGLISMKITRSHFQGLLDHTRFHACGLSLATLYRDKESLFSIFFSSITSSSQHSPRQEYTMISLCSQAFREANVHSYWFRKYGRAGQKRELSQTLKSVF